MMTHNHKPFPHAPPHDQTNTQTHNAAILANADFLQFVTMHVSHKKHNLKELQKMRTCSALAVFPSFLISVCINRALAANVKQTWVWCQLVTASLRQ